MTTAPPPTAHDAGARDSAAFQARLQTRLSPRCRDWQLQCVAETGSTNADLLTAFSRPANDDALRTRLQALESSPSWAQTTERFTPIVRQAQQQTAGRGRLGRAWRSAPGDSLLFSLGVVIPRAIGGLSGLSLALGTAVITGLRQLDIAEPARLGLKWPNDILLDEAKLGGILIETAASSRFATAVVIGVGINLRGEPPALPVSAPPDTPSTSTALKSPLPPAVLSSLLRPSAQGSPTRHTIPADSRPNPADNDVAVATLASVLDAMAAVLERFASDGFAPFRDDWWQMHRFAQRPVVVIDHDQEQMRGRAVGVDDSGRLLIDTADIADLADGTEARSAPGFAGTPRPVPVTSMDTPTLRAVSAGDVSLRSLPYPA